MTYEPPTVTAESFDELLARARAFLEPSAKSGGPRALWYTWIDDVASGHESSIAHGLARILEAMATAERNGVTPEEAVDVVHYDDALVEMA
jgi:hypothetical protein